MTDRLKLFYDFVAFSKAQLTSGDIDPVYPVLKMRYTLDKLGRETALWRTLLYLTWYQLGSAETMWGAWWRPEVVVPVLPTGIERRGFRGPTGAAKAKAFINAVLARAEQVAPGKGLSGWLDSTVRGYGEGARGWRGVRTEMETCIHAGSWASYKWADLVKNVHGYNIVADTIDGGLGPSAGPLAGMKRVFGVTPLAARSPFVQREAMTRCLEAGVEFKGLDQFETCLCDFNSLCKGSYYVGMDIDGMMTQLAPDSPLWEARRMTLPHQYLGELRGWKGIDPERKKVYLKTGTVIERW